MEKLNIHTMTGWNEPPNLDGKPHLESLEEMMNACKEAMTAAETLPVEAHINPHDWNRIKVFMSPSQGNASVSFGLPVYLLPEGEESYTVLGNGQKEPLFKKS